MSGLTSPHDEASSRPIRVAIVDKSPLIRLALEQLLSHDPRLQLKVTVTHGEALVRALANITVDVAVVGWVMPQGDGRFVLEQMRELPEAPRIVIYTGAVNPKVPGEVLTLGGAAFCAKTEPPEQLLDVIRAVAAGRMVFPFVDIRQLQASNEPNLTKREGDFMRALSSGSTNAQLAKELGVSVNTVKFHLGNLYEKLGVNNRAKAVAWYLESEQVRGPDDPTR